MKISIIITTYNCAKFIKQTIASACNQKLIDFNENEIIIIDDGSTDETPSILQAYEKIEYIKIIYSEHIGLGMALNRAILNSQGDFIAILDADDLYHCRKLHYQLEIMLKNPRIGVLATESVVINESQIGFPTDNNDCNKISADEDLKITILNKKLGYYNPINHSSVLMRREAIHQVNGYNEQIKSQLDYDLWIRLAKHDWLIAKINSKLTAKRIHRQQNFESKNRLKYLTSSFHVQVRAIRMLKLPRILYILCVGKFCYGLLPSALRKELRIKRFV